MGDGSLVPLPALKETQKSTVTGGFRQTYGFNSRSRYTISWPVDCQLCVNVLNTSGGPEPTDPGGGGDNDGLSSAPGNFSSLHLTASFPEHQQLELISINSKARPSGLLNHCHHHHPPKKSLEMSAARLTRQPLLRERGSDASFLVGAPAVI